ncbi:MAG: single-stranded-DNA-specific exonuclease RecJ [Anaerolineae bacterium]
MSLQKQRWKLAPAVDPQLLARWDSLFPLIVQLLRNGGFTELHRDRLFPLIVQVLHNRGITGPQEADAFLDGPGIQHDPFALKGMEDAVARLRQAIRRHEPIAVYGDFDTDGVTATALLVDTLSALGARVRPYIPHRVDEGYGLNLNALRRLWQAGVRVVVTVDCGIRSVREASRAQDHLDLIITDHHSVGPDLPPALAILNPHQPGCPYPFKELAGVGVAFKLAQSLLRVDAQMEQASQLDAVSLLELVALGTVADMMPLLGENRTLVQSGLDVLNSTPRPGVEALMADAQVRREEVNATTIGFRLGPRLNAAGRIDTALLAYQLLTSRDPLQTRDLARQLGRLNQQRQDLTDRTVAAAEAQVQEDPDAYLLFVGGPSFHPGIVGLAASRLTDAYYRPSAVLEIGEKTSRASCRSIPEFNITAALEQCSDLLARFGGHAAAAGFTVTNHNLEALRLKLQSIAAHQLSDVDLRPTLEIDARVPLEEIDWDTRALLDQLEPCGMDNPPPVLLSPDVQVRSWRTIGSAGQHRKLELRDGHHRSWDAIYFRHGDLAAQIPDSVDVAYLLDVNEWKNQKRLQLVVQDLRAAT